MKNIFKGKKILVTGGTGSIGSVIVKELLKSDPAVIRILDIDEEDQFYLQHELARFKNIRYLIGDIRNKDRLKLAMRDIDIVFHTAALKHVPLCEYNPFEAIETNIIGTQNVISAAIDSGVKRVVVISTDKATEPTNVMGATKLLAERLVAAASLYSRGKGSPLLSCVRFGNVLNSRGSLVPLVIRQIQKGGPITVTDPKMTRFIMSTEEAIRLLFSAVEKSLGGEVFVLKMPAFKLGDLIDILIERFAPEYGYKKSQIRIKYIGPRPGERYSEILITEQEAEIALESKDMFIIPAQNTFLGTKMKRGYTGTKSAPKWAITSDNVKKIGKKELKELLAKEGL
ncbi:MAG: polysaccharide biosynthesis protein [Candidatus Omnitrophica bacterium]|nr:polysaccharide biosynthesis protein [Candidatus Omnitrophota bacterium]